jgi:hypothetical protein
MNKKAVMWMAKGLKRCFLKAQKELPLFGEINFFL